MSYFISATRNLLVTDSLQEVYQFLRGLQDRGITYARLVDTNLSVKLTDSGFWVWSEETSQETEPTMDDLENQEPSSLPVHITVRAEFDGASQPSCPDCEEAI